MEDVKQVSTMPAASPGDLSALAAAAARLAVQKEGEEVTREKAERRQRRNSPPAPRRNSPPSPRREAGERKAAEEERPRDGRPRLANSALPHDMHFTVPLNCRPGQPVCVQGPHGPLHMPLPQGYQPGERCKVRFGPSEMHQVVVPQGKQPGDVVKFPGPDDVELEARVPAGSSQEFPTALSFDAAGKNVLIALSTHKVLIYDVEAQALSAGLPSLVAIPADVLPLQERINSITTLPGAPERLIFAGHNSLLTLDLKQLALAEEQSQPARESLAEDAIETPLKKRRAAKGTANRMSDASSATVLHISDSTDMSPCVWRTYSKMAMRHIFGLWALDRSRWGKPVLENHFLQQGSSAASEEDDAGSKKRRRMDVEAMLLWVATEALPQWQTCR